MHSRIVGVLAIILVAILVGNIAPTLTISDNIEGFSGEQRTQARAAWRAARAFVGGSLEPLAIRAIRVEGIVDEAPLARTNCRRMSPTAAHPTLVRVQYYTAFGLPWSTVVVVTCDGEFVSVIRV